MITETRQYVRTISEISEICGRIPHPIHLTRFAPCWRYRTTSSAVYEEYLWLSRLDSLLLILALLSAFVVAATAQEGVAPLKPLAGDTSQKSLTGAACKPLSHEVQATLDKLARSRQRAN